MDESYAKAYTDLYRHHWWWSARRERLLSLLTTLSPAEGWRTILDVGCGDGLFFDDLNAFGVAEGVEADATLISASSPYANRIHTGPFDWSFQPAKEYGLILMLDVLEHISDARGALRRAVSLLERGGILVITVPAFNVLWTSHDDRNRHFTRYTKRTFRELAASAGLEIRWMSYWFHWLFLAKLALRFKERLFGERSGGARLPPTWLNRLLHASLRAEARLVDRWKVPMPLGTSLVIVGAAASLSPSQAKASETLTST